MNHASFLRPLQVILQRLPGLDGSDREEVLRLGRMLILQGLHETQPVRLGELIDPATPNQRPEIALLVKPRGFQNLARDPKGQIIRLGHPLSEPLIWTTDPGTHQPGLRETLLTEWRIPRSARLRPFSFNQAPLEVRA